MPFGARNDPWLRKSAAHEGDMLDLLFLALGGGAFALLAGYAVALRRF